MNIDYNAVSTESQNEKIRKYLENGAKITPIEALELFGCFRLSGRIYDLKRSGMKIRMERVKRNGKHIAQYSLWR